jgi:hypothetical protein
MKYIIAFSLPIIIFATACSHKKIVYTDLNGWNEEEGKSVELVVRAIKFKKNKADVTLMVKNNYPFTVVIAENSVRFSMNGDQGAGDENPRWVLKPGDVTVKLMKFTLADKETGPAKLRLEHIYQGETTTVSGVKTDSNTTGTGLALGSRHVAIGTSNEKTTATSEDYVRKTAVEGHELPPVEIVIPH